MSVSLGRVFAGNQMQIPATAGRGDAPGCALLLSLPPFPAAYRESFFSFHAKYTLEMTRAVVLVQILAWSLGKHFGEVLPSNFPCKFMEKDLFPLPSLFFFFFFFSKLN